MKRTSRTIKARLALGLVLLLLPLMVGAQNYTINYAEETITIAEGYSLYDAATDGNTIIAADAERTASITTYIPNHNSPAKTLYLQAPSAEGTEQPSRKEITIPARPQAPNVSQLVLSPDYSKETVGASPFASTDNLEYSKKSSGETAWNDFTKNMSLQEMGWDGTQTNYYFRFGATDRSFASQASVFYLTIPARPAMPTNTPQTTVTSNSITVTAVADQEYRIGENGAWQSGNAGAEVSFSNLNPGTEYTIQYRTKAVNTGSSEDRHFASFANSTTVTTERANSTLTVEPAQENLTYGDELEITVTPSIAAANALTTAQNTVELINANGDVLAMATQPDENNTYTLTYDTKNQDLSIGDNTLTVSFGGSGSLNASTAEVMVNLEKKVVNATLGGVTTKTYDGTTAAPNGLTLALTGVLEGDKVTATGTVAYNTSDVGTGKTITASDIKLTGDDAAYYTLMYQTATNNGGEITAAALSGTLTITGTAQYEQQLTASYDPVHDDEQVTYQWNRSGQPIAGATGNTYTLTEADIEQSITVTATATDNNHTGSVTSTAITVGKASQIAPAAGKGYTIDYPNETIKAGAGYELAATKGDAGASKLTVTPGTDMYIRFAETRTHSASDWTLVDVPDRPEAPSLSHTDETIAGREDGTISGVTTAMEYRLVTSGTWTPCDGTTISNLAPDTYLVRLRATDSSFASEATIVVISAGKEPEPDPTPSDPDPTYYRVDLRPMEGVTIVPTSSVVEEGGTLTFTIEIEEGYVADSMRVTVSQGVGKAIEVEPDETCVYTVKNVAGLVTITVSGVREATTVGMEAIEGVRVYSHEGAIYVYTPTEKRVMVVAMNGVLKASEEQVGKRRYELPRGFYVVWVEGESFKVAN